MERGQRSKHPWQRALDYCRENSSKFQLELAATAYELLTSRFYVIAALPATALIANVPIAGVHAVTFMAVPCLMSVTPRIASFLPTPSLFFHRFSRPYLFAVFAVGVVCTALLFAKIEALGTAPDHSPPVQVILGISLAFSFYYTRLVYVLIANAAITGALASTLFFANPKILAWAGGPQFFGGYMVGTVLAVLLLRFQQLKFYSTSIEQKLNTHLLVELESLVYPHQQMMLETYSKLADTMPLGPHIGNLGEFDIIDSSNMPFKGTYHKVKDAIFARCYTRLLRSYQMNPLAPNAPYSDGHLVKELGDGFIFSVGFPFPPPRSGKCANTSLSLAVDFIREFEASKGDLGSDYDARCVVVLVKQELEAFWTAYRVRQFDFKQQCVTKVSRYQEMRRLLLKRGIVSPTSSFVLMDEGVHASLSPDFKSGLTPIVLADHDLQIRGCPEAKIIYFLNAPHLRTEFLPASPEELDAAS